MGFSGFSRADVEVLKASPGEPVKVRLIDKLHESFFLCKLTDDERLIAEEILRFLAADISSKIRQSISTRFCDDINLPYDVALQLANDLEDIVAVPIIEHSAILKEKDLINIIDTNNPNRQKAVASRTDITERLATKIITKANPEVISTLVNNKAAKLSTGNADLIIHKYSASQPLMRSLVASKKISASQAHDLLTLVTSDLQKMLIIEYNIPSNVVNNLVHDSKEALIINMIMSNLERRNQATLTQMINKLHTEKELTFSVLVKALSFGNVGFFETGLAKLADIPAENVHKILWESEGNTGFNSLYIKAGLPEAMMEAIYKLIVIAHEEQSGDNSDDAKIYYRILNRLARTSNNEKTYNLDYLVTIVAYNLKKSHLL